MHVSISDATTAGSNGCTARDVKVRLAAGCCQLCQSVAHDMCMSHCVEIEHDMMHSLNHEAMAPTVVSPTPAACLVDFTGLRVSASFAMSVLGYVTP
jgi:hypothetical protein